jgi:aspartyl-tRNA(Asn)/glutamyl-tRNA(Gln) amidotransferase subunit A
VTTPHLPLSTSSDPAAEAAARIGRLRNATGGPVPDTVLVDAERQVAGMLTGLRELADAVPALDQIAALTVSTASVSQVASPPRAQHVASAASTSAGTGAPLQGTGTAGAQDVFALSLVELADRLRTRDLSPVEVTRAALDRIQAHDSALHTFITLTAEQALEDARRAEAEFTSGSYRGPLHGVPLAAKDLYDVRGVPTTAGSAILRNYVPAEDSAAVAAWRRAGAVLLGKNTLHEFAFGGTSVNGHTGTPRNPWNTAHMCGGSSGGSAAAVAAGFAYGAFGSETGNSIRRPASFCGVVGLKPTFGRCSRRGVVPLAWSLDHVGVFARTAADAALLTDPLTGFDPTDPGSRTGPGGSVAPIENLGGVRLGVLRSLLLGIDPEVLAAFEGALETLRAAGVAVQNVDLPLASRWTAIASSITMQAEAAAVHGRWLRERTGEYGADVLARLLAGEALTAGEYARAQAIRQAIQEELAQALSSVDAIAFPATPAPAPTLQGGALVPGDAPFSTAPSAFHLQRLWSLTGLPAVSAPMGLHSNGLPMGIQLAGRPWEERVPLGMAQAVMAGIPSERSMPAVAPLA